MKRISVLVASVILAIFFAPVSANAQKTNVLFIVDFSGSMNEKFGVEPKVDAAKKAFQETMKGLSPDTNVGVMVFGHIRPGKFCDDITVLSPIGQKPAKDLVDRIGGLDAQGWTPIAASLLKAKSEFANRKGENNSIVLITDGREECDGKVCDAVDELSATGIKVKVHVVGLDHKDADRKAVECITKISGGVYAAANNTAEIIKAITDVITVQQGSCPSISSRPADIRDWIRSGHIKVAIKDVRLSGDNSPYWWDYNMSLSVENCSGIGLGISLGGSVSGWSLGPCKVTVKEVGGLQFAEFRDQQDFDNWKSQPNPSGRLQWFPAGERTNGVIRLNASGCKMPANDSVVSSTIRFHYSDDKNTAFISYSTDKVPIVK